MRDAASELRRISLPRTPVNKGKRKGRGVELQPGPFVPEACVCHRRPPSATKAV